MKNKIFTEQEVQILAEKEIKDGEDYLIMNNRPPNLTEDFGITDEEDKIDQEMMPNETVKLNKSEKRN